MNHPLQLPLTGGRAVKSPVTETPSSALFSSVFFQMRDPELDLLFMMQFLNLYNCRIIFLFCFQFFCNSHYCSNNIAANTTKGKF